MYDEKKVEAKVKREELEDELADVEKKIREVGPNDGCLFGTSSYWKYIPISGLSYRVETVKVNLEAETACEVSLTITTSRHPEFSY